MPSEVKNKSKIRFNTQITELSELSEIVDIRESKENSIILFYILHSKIEFAILIGYIKSMRGMDIPNTKSSPKYNQA